jgi:hypothetical protein
MASSIGGARAQFLTARAVARRMAERGLMLTGTFVNVTCGSRSD